MPPMSVTEFGPEVIDQSNPSGECVGREVCVVDAHRVEKIDGSEKAQHTVRPT